MDSAYYEAITSHPSFKFIVGSEQKVFYLHSGLVSAQSDVLKVLVNGDMKEAKEQCADWTDTKVETFTCFAMFAYTGDYISAYDKPNEDKTTKNQNKNTSSSFEYDDDDYYCGRKSSSSRRFVTDCPDNTCNHSLSDWPSNAKVKGDNLTIHAQMYAFGDYHGIDTLCKLALRKLHRMLNLFEVSKDTLITLADLVRFCYANTRTIGKEPLRQMVSLYCAKAFMSHRQEFVVDSLMRTVPEFAADVFQKIQA